MLTSWSLLCYTLRLCSPVHVGGQRSHSCADNVQQECMPLDLWYRYFHQCHCDNFLSFLQCIHLFSLKIYFWISSSRFEVTAMTTGNFLQQNRLSLEETRSLASSRPMRVLVSLLFPDDHLLHLVIRFALTNFLKLLVIYTLSLPLLVALSGSKELFDLWPSLAFYTTRFPSFNKNSKILFSDFRSKKKPTMVLNWCTLLFNTLS